MESEAVGCSMESPKGSDRTYSLNGIGMSAEITVFTGRSEGYVRKAVV